MTNLNMGNEMTENEGNLTASYIDDHMTNVHTYESFARTLVEMIMAEARDKATGGEQEITISVDFVVSKAVAAGCFKICPRKWFCIHIS